MSRGSSVGETEEGKQLRFERESRGLTLYQAALALDFSLRDLARLEFCLRDANPLFLAVVGSAYNDAAHRLPLDQALAWIGGRR